MKTLMKLSAATGAMVSLLVGSSFLNSSTAQASPCTATSVATIMNATFSCSIGPLTFSHFTVTPTVVGTALLDYSSSTAFTPLAPFAYGGHTEYGFALSYTALAATVGSADLSLTYDVTSSPGSMVDAYASLTGSADGSAAFISLSETLSNGVTLNIGPNQTGGIAYDAFDPSQVASSIHAVKDDGNTALDGVATSSVLEDTFSVGGGVPEPGTFALFGAALLGGTLWLRRRRSIH